MPNSIFRTGPHPQTLFICSKIGKISFSILTKYSQDSQFPRASFFVPKKLFLESQVFFQHIIF
ncbi:unnamed protein product [Meloidogyne enterolobii]|uniref:Uncharacterized protein n=1 Tax=Meloidogyne enterolobii TaxID=390850 RepID=A0ACB1B824_MELEN